MQSNNQNQVRGRYSDMSVVEMTNTDLKNLSLIERSTVLNKWLPVRFAIGTVCIMLAVLAAYL